MISSVDGRLQHERYSDMFSGKSRDVVVDAYMQQSSAFNGNGWMVGRKSVQELLFPGTFSHENLSPAKSTTTHIAPKSSPRAAIVVDPKGRIEYSENKIMGEDIITILGKDVSEQYLETLRAKEISYVFGGSDGYNLKEAVDTLYNEFGMEHILLEGGGSLNGSFLKAGLIDELSVMIYPGIDGLSGISSIFEYFGEQGELPAEGQTLELISVKELNDGIVWLQYKFHKKA